MRTSRFWATAVVLACTAVPAAAQPIKISQVYGGGAAVADSPYNRDYVELRNAGAFPVSLDGWSVQYAAATGTIWSRTDLPAATIQPGGYFLIQMTLTGANGADLPFPDHVVSTAINMSATTGKVALVRSTATLTGACPLPNADVVDFIGYGTANCFEGAVASAPSNLTAAIRTGDGCDDTNNNSVDFLIGVPMPRNSQVPPNPCPLPPGSDIDVAMTGPANCAVVAGNAMSYSITVTNMGPDPAAGVVLTNNLPAGTTFIDSSPDLIVVGGQLTYNIGGMAVGASQTLVVTVQTAVGMPSAFTTASAFPSTPDNVPGNNAASLDVTLLTDTPTTSQTEVLFSTIPGSNAVPGLPGVVFDTSPAFDRPVRSYNGRHWMMTADATPGTTRGKVLLVGQGANVSVGVQEGVTMLPTFETVGNIDPGYGINDAGDYAFGASLGASNKAIIRSTGQGAQLEVVARQGDSVPAIPGAAYGGTMLNPSFINSGQVSFYSNLVGPPAANDTCWLADDGQTLIAQEGITAPAGQLGGAQETWRVLDTGGTVGRGLSRSADGNRSLTTGMIGPSGLFDLVAVVDGTVAIQESVPIAGSNFVDGVSLIKSAFMEPHGNWIAQGSNFLGASTNGVDWVVRNGEVIAARDEEIHPGAGLFWSDTAFAACFFFAASNRFGDYVVGGLTTHNSTLDDAIIVFNGRRILLRENDPVDLNNNGINDDDAYIHVFRDDHGFLSEDGYFYTAIRLRNGAGICSGGTPAEIGQAFIRVRAFCPADWNRDDSVNSQDISAYITSWLAAVSQGGLRADFNGDGAVNSTDISAFITAWLSAVAGGC